MAGMKWSYSGSGTIANHATTHTWLAAVTAPANQKLLVSFFIAGKGTAGQTPLQLSLRRGCDLTGATTSSQTPRKVSSQDAETAQGVPKTFSVQPTDVSSTNGTRVWEATRQPTEGIYTDTVEIAGGETLCLVGITATNSCVVDWVMRVVE